MLAVQQNFDFTLNCVGLRKTNYDVFKNNNNKKIYKTEFSDFVGRPMLKSKKARLFKFRQACI